MRAPSPSAPRRRCERLRDADRSARACGQSRIWRSAVIIVALCAIALATMTRSNGSRWGRSSATASIAVCPSMGSSMTPISSTSCQFSAVRTEKIGFGRPPKHGVRVQHDHLIGSQSGSVGETISPRMCILPFQIPNELLFGLVSVSCGGPSSATGFPSFVTTILAPVAATSSTSAKAFPAIPKPSPAWSCFAFPERRAAHVQLRTLT